MKIFERDIVKATMLVVLLLVSCNQTPSGPNQPLNSNLIQNPTFEVNGKPSLQTWTADTMLAEIVRDAPSGDGIWSLQLVPGWIPREGFAQTYVSGETGTGVYKLTLWMKSINNWRGGASFGVWSHNTWVSRKMVTSDSSQWAMVSLLDTLSLTANDSIAVHLSAGATELASGEVLFDEISLERVQ